MAGVPFKPVAIEHNRPNQGYSLIPSASTGALFA